MEAHNKVGKAILSDINRVARKLKKTPEKHEYLQHGRFKEWQIRKHFDGWTKALSESGTLKYFDPEIKHLSDLQIKLTELRKEMVQKDLQIESLQNEALTSKKIRGLIKGLVETDIDGRIKWMKSEKLAKTKGIPVLFLSDIHFDEIVMPDQIQGLNKFNRDIAIKRLQHTFNRSIDLLMNEIKDPKYDGFVLALGGDLLSGNIHEELSENNEAQILQSAIVLLDVLISGIEKLADKFGKVFAPCVVGNHGRIHKQPRMKNRVFDNYEWLVYTFLQRHFSKDSRVTFMIPDGADAQFQIYDKTFLLTHGDQFRGGAGISGIFTPLMLGMSRKQKRNASVGRAFDVMMVGHFHQLIQTNTLIINGSVKGYDEYAFISNFNYEPPQQALFVVHPRIGITHQMPILCDGYVKDDKPVKNTLKPVW